MATTFAKGLFGVDPAEYSMQQQKLWSNLYSQASSPYEKMGIALAQIGGTALGLNETAVDKKIADISKVLNDIGTQYQVGTAEYYKAVADALPAEYPDAKAQAQAEYIKFKANETKTYADAVTAIQKNPEIVDTFADPLKISVLQKATRKGWSEEETPVPTTVAEMADFAKKFGLTTDPEYRRYVAMNKVADKEGKKETLEAEIKLLTKENIEVQIQKNKKELNRLASDNFTAGDRWNAEREAAISLFRAAGLDPTKPLRGANLANTELVNAQSKALRDPWTGKGNVTITPPSAVGAPPPVAPAAKPATTTPGTITINGIPVTKVK
jgi:hypothetical protein